MKLVHTHDMNYQRITISLPDHVYNDLIFFLGKGKISEFIAEIAEEKMLDRKLPAKDPIDDFFAHKKNLPKLTDKQIMAAIRKGRM